MPKDPRDTLSRVQAGVLRIGISEAHPWVTGDSTQPEGVEVMLAQDLAETLGAKIEWRRDGAEALFELPEHFEVDMVLAGIKHDNPWKDRIALSRPYLIVTVNGKEEQHVWALPPGENAWILEVERFLQRNEARAARIYQDMQ